MSGNGAATDGFPFVLVGENLERVADRIGEDLDLERVRILLIVMRMLMAGPALERVETGKSDTGAAAAPRPRHSGEACRRVGCVAVETFGPSISSLLDPCMAGIAGIVRLLLVSLGSQGGRRDSALVEFDRFWTARVGDAMRANRKGEHGAAGQHKAQRA
ncbi:MAG TPA: hypothetical protein VGA56_02565 [Opitutaceae bacterium]